MEPRLPSFDVGGQGWIHPGSPGWISPLAPCPSESCLTGAAGSQKDGERSWGTLRVSSPLARLGGGGTRSGPCPQGASAFGWRFGVIVARSQQEREALQKWLNKPRKNELGKELLTEQAILEDKCNLWI